MSSSVPSPLSALEAQSRDLIEPVQNRLAAFCADTALQARFLNTLSLMEHIGSRKIMASQGEAGLTHDTLKHLAEETRHAFFFKRAAETRAGHALGYAAHETIAGASARFYMGRLDAEIAAQLPEGTPRPLAYLYMSLIVELRAIWFYRHYQAVLAERGDRLSLTGVLAEEEHHLDAMMAEISALDGDAPARIARFAAFEDTRFRAFWSAIEAESAPGRLAAE
jgi:hypothetical protein